MRSNLLSKALAVALSATLATTSISPAFAADATNADKPTQSDITLVDDTAADNAVVGDEAATRDAAGEEALATDAAPVESEGAALDAQSAEATPLLDTRAGAVTITSESQLAPLFPDAPFRAAVFAAVKDGQEGAVGANVTEALANFTGSVSAKSKGITNITGIELLRKANVVDLTKNMISDYSGLGTNSNNTPHNSWYGFTSEEYQKYLDGGGEERANTTNVTWILAANPIERIPASFGGQLVIEQMARSSYTYPEDLSEHFTSVRSDSESLSGTLDIAKAFVVDGASETNVRLVSAAYSAHGTSATTQFDITSFTNATADFANLKKSGIGYVAVGTEQDIHFQTLDEAGTLTPGSVSFKYYLPTRFSVYDKVTIDGAAKGSAKLVKTDADTKAALPGATFSLYKQDGTLVQEGLVTDVKGEIAVADLNPGAYYFKETAAPAGYQINQDKIAVTVQSSGVSLGGGTTEVTPTTGAPVQAAEHEVFIAGPDSPDITLTDGTSTVNKITVKYASLEGSTGEVVRTFTSTSEAVADLNKEKNANKILGPASITVEYATTGGGSEATVTAENAKIPLITIPVTKNWVDNPAWHGTRVDIKIHLTQNGTVIDTWDLKGTQTSTGGKDTFTHTFDGPTHAGLPAVDQNGKAYEYLVSEDDIVTGDDVDGLGYTSSVSGTATDGFTVTNTWVNGEVFSVAGQKNWSDFTATTRPATVELTLKQTNGTYSSTISLKSADDWKFAFKALPKWKVEQQELFTYVLEEKSVSGYASFAPVNVPLTKDTADKGTITLASSLTTNTFANNIVKLEGEKVWVDFNDAGGLRPADIEVQLLQDGAAYGTPATATATGDWKYSFKDLPKYNTAGKEYVYTVAEPTVPEGYTSVVAGTTVTNTLNNKSVAISGEKVWEDFDDAAGIRPVEIEIQLMQNGVPYLAPVTTTADDDWKYNFKNLPKFDTTGEEYTYTVQEVAIPEGYASVVAGTTITNTLTNETALDGQKTWVGDVETDRPASIDVTLLQNGTVYGAPATATAAGDWKYSFTGLPLVDSKTNTKYVYTVKEAAIPDGYTSAVTGTTITNTKIPSMDIPVTKNWVDNPTWPGTRVDIKIHLMQNGTVIDTWDLKGTQTSTGGKDTFTHTFTGLPTTDQNGKAYTYSVSEDDIVTGDDVDGLGYTPTYSGNATDGFVITNTWVQGAIFNIAGEKIWNDLTTSTRPDAIELTLTRDDGGYTSTIHPSVNPDGTWTFSFKALPLYHEGTTTLYQYTLTETPVPDYTSFDPVVIPMAQAGDKKTIQIDTGLTTNTFKNVTAVAGTKVWEDFDNSLNTRPTEITVNLSKKSDPTKIIASQQVTGEGDTWSYKFDALAEYETDGSKIEYQVAEELKAPASDIYTAAVVGATITNTLHPEKIMTVLDGTKVWVDSSNAANLRPAEITVNVFKSTDNKTPVATQQVKGEGDSWSYKFDSLPKYEADGTEISYVVTETAVEGYTSAVEGTIITNTLKPKEVGSVSISLEKKWIDEGAETARPESIVVSLLQNGTELKQITLSAAGGWKASEANLPKADAEGKAYDYTVKEAEVSGYKLTGQTWDKADDGNSWTGTFTNTLIKPLVPGDPGTPGTPTDPATPPAPQTPGGKKLVSTGDPFNLGAPLALIAVAAGVVVLSSKRLRTQPRKK